MAAQAFLNEMETVILGLGTHYIGRKPKITPANKSKVKNEPDAFAKWVVRQLNNLFKRADTIIL
jgi:hypothetical protein